MSEVEVRCDREKCKWNDEGECTCEVIVLDEDGVCLDYECFRK